MKSIILPSIARRYSPRGFAPEKVSIDDLITLFQAAQTAPSAYNEQPWRFIVAGKEQSELFEKFLSLLAEANRTWAQSAQYLVAAVAKNDFTKFPDNNTHAAYDLGGAVATLTIQAVNQGILVQQMGGFDRQAAQEQLNIPDNFSAYTILAIGRPLNPAESTEEIIGRKNRLPVNSVVFEGSFGTEHPGTEEVHSLADFSQN